MKNTPECAKGVKALSSFSPRFATALAALFAALPCVSRADVAITIDTSGEPSDISSYIYGF